MSFPSRSGVWTRPVRARRTGSVVWATRHETALLLVAEMVTRGTRPTGITAVIQWSGTAVVAAVAAVVSYGHMRALLLSYGETALVACLLPLSVDGLLLVASVALARPAIPRHGGSAEDHVDPGVHMVPTGPVSLGAEELGTPVPDRHGDGTDSAHDRHGTGEPVPVLAAAAAHEVVTVPLGAEDGQPGDDRERARAAYRAARAEDVPLTGKQLAERFGRSESWGRARIRECRVGTGKTSLTG